MLLCLSCFVSDNAINEDLPCEKELRSERQLCLEKLIMASSDTCTGSECYIPSLVVINVKYVVKKDIILLHIERLITAVQLPEISTLPPTPVRMWCDVLLGFVSELKNLCSSMQLLCESHILRQFLCY